MPETTEDAAKKETAFGLTPSRVRGVIAVLVLIIGLYAILFESEPPPVFEDVEISIPEKPKPDFNERTIVLPEFETSPQEEGAEPAEGVVIEKPEVEAAPVPEPATARQEAAPAPAPEVAEIEPEPAAEPAPEPKPEPEPAPQVAEPAANEFADTGFFVQIAALKSRKDAEEQAAAIGAALGEPYYVQETRRNGETFFRVRLGPYGDDEAKARATLARLIELRPGSEGSIVDSE